MLLGERKNSKFNSYSIFAKLISKNSKTQVIIVNNEIELGRFLKKNLISDEIIIGMGAGIISKWMAGLKVLIMTFEKNFIKKFKVNSK